MIVVRVFYNGNPASDVKVQTDYDNEVVYTEEHGLAIFEEVPTGKRTIYVCGKEVIDRVYKENGKYGVSLDFNPYW